MENEQRDLKREFLAASIIDVQATIRALDFKGYVFLLLLTLPFSKLETILPGIAKLWKDGGLAPSIILVCAVTWVGALVATLQCLANVTDPATKVRADAPPARGVPVPPRSGLFFPAQHYERIGLVEALLGRGPTSKLTPATLVVNLPTTSEDVVRELAYEQLKVGFILARKSACTRYALLLTAIWGVSGLGVWACWAFRQWTWWTHT